MAGPNKTVDQNILPVQALFNLDNTFNTFIGQGQPFYASVNPVQSGLTITNSTINSSVIGGSVPAAATFTSMATTTGTVANTPASPTDIVNKSYVDMVAQGYQIKAEAQCATTVNITLSGLQTIDGYTTLAGDRVLVKNQSNQANNGVYVAASGAWSRSTDCATYASLVSAFIFIQNGSTQQNTGWACTIPTSGTLGTTSITWSQLASSVGYFAGTGLTLSSYTFSITNTGVSAGSYGSASSVGTFTVNAQGQLTSAGSTSISIAPSQINAAIPNSSLANSSVTFNGVSVSLGGSGSITAQTPNALTIGTGLSGGSFNGSAAVTIANTGVLSFSAGTTGFTPSTATTGAVTLGGTLNVANGGTGATTLTGYVYGNGTGAMTASTTIPTSALTGNFVSTFSGGTTGLTPSSATAGAITLSGTLAVANGGTGVTSSSGANSVVLRDSNGNVTTNCLFEGYTTQAASGTTIVLTAASVQNWAITGSGGQTIQLPNATTLPAGATFTFNNNQSSGTIVVQNNSATTVVTIQSGAYATVVLLSNSIAAGTWDYHNAIPSNASWSTNTLSWAGSYTNGTWNGNAVGLLYGGTNAALTAVAGGVVYSGASALAISAAGTTGQVLTSNGSSAPTWSTPTAYATVTDDTTTNATRYPLFAATTSGNLTTEYTSSTKYQFNPSTGTLTATVFSGSGASLTSIPNSALNNSSITVGTTAIALGASSTTLAGLTSVTSTTFVGALTGNASTATTATTATNANNVAITDNTSSSSTWYPVLSAASTGNNPATTSSTKLSFVPSTGVLSANGVALTGNLGTVTSVAATVPSFLSISGSPITSSGTLAITLSGTALPTTSGGTGLTSFTSGGVVYASSTSALATSSAFTFNGTNVSFTGNLIPTTAGKGINFTANTPQSGMTSQLLNWYEEGTWTPTFANLTVVGTPTYTGKYTRIGRMVSFTLRIQATTSTTSGAGATYFNQPIAQFSNRGTLTAANGNASASYGVGLIADDGNCYLPTWVTVADVSVSGFYFV